MVAAQVAQGPWAVKRGGRRWWLDHQGPSTTPCSKPVGSRDKQAAAMAWLILPSSNDGVPLAVSSLATLAQSKFTASHVFAVPLACGADFPSLSKVTAAEEQLFPASLSEEVWPSLVLPLALLKLNLRLFW